MKLIYKLMLGFLAVAMLTGIAAYYAVHTSEKALQESIERDSVMLARETMDNIDRVIYYRTERWESFADSDPVLHETVLTSNLQFEKLAGRQEYINKTDRDWKEGNDTPLIHVILNNKLSKALKRMTAFHEAKQGHSIFPEVFITNRHGVVIAATGRTLDYLKADEQWYQTAIREKGHWVGDVEYHDSSDTYACDMVFNLYDRSGNFAGILKVVLNIKEIINGLNTFKADGHEGHKTGHLQLSTIDGRLIYSTRENEFSTEKPFDGPVLHSGLEKYRDHDDFLFVGKAVGKDKVIVHAHSTGYMDYKGLGWILSIEHEKEELFAPVYDLKKRLLTTSMAVVVFGIALGFVFSSPISGNIRKLKDAALKIGKGDLNTEIDIRSKDEIGALAESFKQMTEDLRSTTVSRDNLAQEIAERREIEASLKKAAEELGRANSELKEFAYLTSHDLQETLRMVTSYVQLLEGRLDGDADMFIKYSVDGAVRMKRLINDLQSCSRIDTHGREFSSVDSMSVLQSALYNLQVATRESGAVVTHDTLPQVVVDETQFVQLFQNLIGNAVKFRGDEAPVVHVSSEEREHEWLFSVRDNGTGIEPEYSKRIFGVFQRLHNKTEYPSTGIGLAACRKIVERHGGRIWVESGPENGSTFYFTVPKQEVDNYESQQTY